LKAVSAWQFNAFNPSLNFRPENYGSAVGRVSKLTDI